jgi:hypothetical protein
MCDCLVRFFLHLGGSILNLFLNLFPEIPWSNTKYGCHF